MFAGAQGDLVIGVDLHMEMVPTPTPIPTPFPMPFVGVIEPDAIDFLIQIGAAKALSWAFDLPASGPVLIHGMPAAKTGDEARNHSVLPHMVIPPGTMWATLPKPLKLTMRPGPPPPPDSPTAPAGDAILVTGSDSVSINGNPACRLGDTAASRCACRRRRCLSFRAAGRSSSAAARSSTTKPRQRRLSFGRSGARDFSTNSSRGSRPVASGTSRTSPPAS